MSTDIHQLRCPREENHYQVSL